MRPIHVSDPELAHFILELRPRRTRPNANDGGRVAAVEARIAGKFNFENPC